MTPPFPLLASPIRLAGLELANRTVMAAMSSVLGSAQGEVTPEQIAYYRARAAGGTALIVVEFTCVDRRLGRAEPRQLVLDDDDAIDGHARLVAAIRGAGASAALQLHAPGQFADARTLHGLPAGPSALAGRDGSPLVRALTADEIDGLIASFAAAARRARAAGYQAIEIHGAHGYLPMAFLSPLKNQRDDAWGGDAPRRRAFAAAVIRAVKAALGPQVPLIWRLSSADFTKGGLDLPAMLDIVPHLVAAGADAIHVSSGAIEGTLDRTIDPMSAPEGWRFAHARQIRAAAGVPVIAVGPVRWPARAEQAIAAGDVDMVALGRPLLADPAWTAKALAGQTGAIRPCTNCNWCFDRVLRHGSIACAENPATGAETEAPPARAGNGRPVIVVGAGPGGMAAALDLAAAGFRTALFERQPQPGGGLVVSAAPPHKEKLLWYLDHLRARLAASAVTLHTGATVDAARLIAAAPHAVVLATGAQDDRARLAWACHPRVLSAYALLAGEVAPPPPGDLPVIVYGGGETGCETAEYLTARGHRVVLVSRSPSRQLARSAEPMYRKQLRARLQANPALEIRDSTSITGLDAAGLHLLTPLGPEILAVDQVIIAQGRQPGAPLAAALRAAGIPVIVIGDAQQIGRIGDAVHAARAATRQLLQGLRPDTAA